MQPLRHAEFIWGHMDWWLDDPANRANISIADMTVLPGGTGERHRHGNCHEVLIVREGRVRCLVGEAVHDIGPGDRVLLPPGTPHRVDNPHMDPALLTVVYSAASREYDAC